MSSFWDGLGQKFYDNKLTFEDIADLLEFLRGFDKVNNNMVSTMLKKTLYNMTSYEFVDYDKFEQDLQNKGMSRRTLEFFIGTLHDFDHAYEQILMNSYYKDKRYWHKHKMYRSYMGTFKDGVYKPRKE